MAKGASARHPRAIRAAARLIARCRDAYSRRHDASFPPRTWLARGRRDELRRQLWREEPLLHRGLQCVGRAEPVRVAPVPHGRFPALTAGRTSGAPPRSSAQSSCGRGRGHDSGHRQEGQAGAAQEGCVALVGRRCRRWRAGARARSARSRPPHTRLQSCRLWLYDSVRHFDGAMESSCISKVGRCPGRRGRAPAACAPRPPPTASDDHHA